MNCHICSLISHIETTETTYVVYCLIKRAALLLGASAYLMSCAGSGKITAMQVSGAYLTRIATSVINSSHTCVVTTAGRIRCWGSNNTGQLGIGSTTDIGDTSTTEIADTGDITFADSVAAISVAAGGSSALNEGFSCALFENKKVRCWGKANYGDLGNGSSVGNIGDAAGEMAALDYINLGGNAVQVVAGRIHACALLEEGNVRCWGSGGNGALGYGDSSNVGATSTSDIVNKGDVNVGEKVVQITAGYDHTCALTISGGVRCWGSNSSGKLGYGLSTASIVGTTSPNEIVNNGDINLGGRAVFIDSGSFTVCALMEDANVRCWGESGFGRTGYGTTVDIGDDGAGGTVASHGNVNVGGPVAKISTGTGQTCALLQTGAVRCWGLAASGCLGWPAPTDVADNDANEIATSGDLGVGGTVVDIDAGAAFSCVVLTGGGVKCFGAYQSGNLGYGASGNIGDSAGELAAQALVNIGALVVTPNRFPIPLDLFQ